jgi:hypothetical protein
METESHAMTQVVESKQKLKADSWNIKLSEVAQ